MRNKRGGKKHKKNKNVATTRELLFKEDEQDYGLVTRVLGNRRFMILLQDTGSEVIGKVCGSMKNREWCHLDDWVLVNLRDFEEGKVDIIRVYKKDEERKLKAYGEIVPPASTTSKSDIMGVDQDENIHFGIKWNDEEVDDL